MLADPGVQELCCPPGTRCIPSSHTFSHIMCCPYFSSCSDSVAQCLIHTFERPSALGGGCCASGPRRALHLCLEYQYKTLAVFQPIQIPGPTPDFIECVLAETSVAPLEVPPPGNQINEKRTQICTWSDCAPDGATDGVQDLPISDRILGTPTAWRAKIGEAAVTSQADEVWEKKEGSKRLRRLGCVVAGLVLIIGMMILV